MILYSLLKCINSDSFSYWWTPPKSIDCSNFSSIHTLHQENGSREGKENARTALTSLARYQKETAIFLDASKFRFHEERWTRLKNESGATNHVEFAGLYTVASVHTFQKSSTKQLGLSKPTFMWGPPWEGEMNTDGRHDNKWYF